MVRLNIVKQIICLAFLCAGFIFSGCSQVILGGNSVPERSDYPIVEIDSAHQTCEKAADCITTYVDCSGCDCGIPINLKYENHYLDLYNDVCAEYAGPVCEIYCPPITLICSSGICEAEPSE